MPSNIRWTDKLIGICLMSLALLPYFLFAMFTAPIVRSLYGLTPFFEMTIDNGTSIQQAYFKENTV